MYKVIKKKYPAQEKEFDRLVNSHLKNWGIMPNRKRVRDIETTPVMTLIGRLCESTHNQPLALQRKEQIHSIKKEVLLLAPFPLNDLI